MTYKSISPIEESGPLVHIDKHHLPDLDDLMLDVWAWSVKWYDLDLWDEPWSYTDERTGRLMEFGGDIPTRIPDGGYSWGGEAMVGYYRKNPCTCGGEHTFDMAEVDMDDDGNPVGTGARGAFLAVYVR